ncbi:MAG: hypothetical protein CBD88_00150 [Flavobacteriales bacterium TMED228]|nr:MAG: hypothetical protein CBD88_00150 [Flavobacteriales bacterium TMED228]
MKKKSNIDYAAPHIRQQAFRMRLLKFYKTIEFNDDVYNHNATMILKGTLPYRFVNEIERLRLEHEKKKKEKWDKIKKRGATTLGLQVRDIIKRSTQER